jgi:hypothetical protein
VAGLGAAACRGALAALLIYKRVVRAGILLRHGLSEFRRNGHV